MVEAARRYLPLDALSLFCEDLALTADGYVQENAADKVIKLGAGRTDGSWVIDVAAIDATTGDESATLRLVAANEEDFSGVVEILSTLDLGAARPLSALDTTIGRYEVPFANNIGGREYAYVKMHVDTGGTTPAITISSWLTDGRY